MKFLKRFLPVLLLFVAVFVGTEADVRASASDENISVIVPVTVGITFNEDGSTSCTTFNVFNRSSVQIEITSVHATELNDWKLVSSDTAIGLDSKQLSFELEGTEILPGENEMSLLVKEMGLHNFHTDIKRGAWTYSFDYEEAFMLEFQYEIAKEKYTLTLDGGDYAEDSMLQVKEGATITLPELMHDTYEFMGWADSSGKRYTDTFTMPNEETTLIALWNLSTYALITEGDYALSFVQSKREIKEGEEYKGKTIVAVYTDFIDIDFDSYQDVPWYEYCKDIESVIFEDPVFPRSTAYWFYELRRCMYYDVTNLYTFRVTDMRFMYWNAGSGRDDMGFVITGMENWDTSQVTNMWSMFENCGCEATTYNIGNIGLWDVSRVYNMESMFYTAAMKATDVYIGDLGMWDTSSLENIMDMFFDMGCSAKSINIGNIGTWDISKVDDLTCVFRNMGANADSVYVGDLGQWDVSNVYDFWWTFSGMAAHAKDFYVGDLSNWNMTKAKCTWYMFQGAGEFSETFYLGDISKWNVANVDTMNCMFENAGRVADWQLDLSTWNVACVKHYASFAYGVESKIKEPIWLY